MFAELKDFDITLYDSKLIDGSAPSLLAQRLLHSLLDADLSECQLSEVNLRFFVDALVAINLVPSNEREWASRLLSMMKSGEAFSLKPSFIGGGSSILIIESVAIVHLGAESTSTGTYDLLNALNNVAEEHSTLRTWIFDFSDIREVTDHLLAYLSGFQTSLRDGNLLLLWVRKDALASDLKPTFTKRFNLMKKGAYVVSRPLSGANSQP